MFVGTLIARSTTIANGSICSAGAVAPAVRAAIKPETDLHASSDYRRQLAGTLVGRALAAALQRAGAT